MVQPYPFDKLKNFHAKELDAINSLTRIVPVAGDILGVLVKALRKYLGDTFDIHFESLYLASYDRYLAALPERFVGVLVACANKKIILEMDPDFAFASIDKMLGGEGEVPRELRSLTKLEEGVLQFLVTTFLKELAKYSACHLRYDQIASSVDKLQKLELSSEATVVASFRVKLHETESTLRINFPNPSSLNINFNPVSSSRVLREWGDMPLILSAQAGHVTLSPSDIQALRSGDIILLDEALVEYDGKNLTGNLHLMLQDQGYISASIVEEKNDQLALKVENIVPTY